jgi:hypothetical protein
MHSRQVRSRSILGFALLALLATPPARGVETPIAGKIHIIKDGKLTKMVAPGTYTLPTPLGANDPTIAGGLVSVVDTDDGVGFVTSLPSAAWTGLGNPAGSSGYKYKGAGTPGDPCKVVLVKETIIKFVCKDDQLLDPPLGGESAIRLALGTDAYCAEFGGVEIKNVAGLLKRKDAGAPGGCFALTTTTTSSTTSTTVGGACCNSATFHSFLTTYSAGGDCGDVLDLTGTKTRDLDCAGLYFGGGGTSVPLPVTLPDLANYITEITACTGQSATLGAATSTDTGSNLNCTAAGCFFGAPLSVPNSVTTPTSTCVVNVVATDGAGSLDCSTGAQTLDIPLASIVYLTGDTAVDPMSTIAGIQPCPLCSGGSCVGGPNDTLPCEEGTTALNDSYPTSHDCPPDPSFDIGTLPISFLLSSGSLTWTGTPATNDTGEPSAQSRVFSGYCRDTNSTLNFQNPGQKCWENGVAVGPACAEPAESCEQRSNGAFGPGGGSNRTITEIGAPQLGVYFGPAPGTLVSIFSIPPTFNATVDAVGDLPGPGAVALPGTGKLCTDPMSCP